MIAALWAKLKFWVLAAAAVAAALLGAWWQGRREGKQAAAHERSRERLKAIEQVKEIDDEVSGLGADDLDRRLKRWVRDGDG
ncbi:MAG: hypothetical protein Kow0032_07210 [Methyloligellaceae bacterium]